MGLLGASDGWPERGVGVSVKAPLKAHSVVLWLLGSPYIFPNRLNQQHGILFHGEADRQSKTAEQVHRILSKSLEGIPQYFVQVLCFQEDEATNIT